MLKGQNHAGQHARALLVTRKLVQPGFRTHPCAAGAVS